MLNKLSAFIREKELIHQGDSVVCALSGGADSTALLYGLYLLKDRLGFQLSAAHFNHHLRGDESDADENFVRGLCDRLDIPLFVGGAKVTAGKKGLEAAAREERYAFLRSLPGLIATAHTADDNAETVLMHLLRGSGLKGLGGIAPLNGRIIRPMLLITREDVENFLQENCLRHIEDSSNETDAFLRNRIRHNVVPLLTAENPSFARSASSAALRLRQDEDFLQTLLQPGMPGAEALRQMHPALRMRYLERFLKEGGVSEPEQIHIAALEKLVFSPKPSASADFPGGIVIARNYDRLEFRTQTHPPECALLNPAGVTELPQWGIRVSCTPAETICSAMEAFTVVPVGTMMVRSRRAGDALRLYGGTKLLKKLLIDKKIPAACRDRIPVICDDAGVLAVPGLGVNLDRIADGIPAVEIHIEKFESEK